MAFTWATDPGADVQEPSSGRKALGYETGNKPPAGEFNWLFQQVANISGLVGYTFEGVGGLDSMVGLDMGQYLITSEFEIGAITVVCPQTPASGTIEFGLWKVTPGGAAVNLYTSNPLPALTCNGGYAAATIASGSLPNTTTIAAGDLLIVRLTAAPADARDILVSVS
jgi:hypothetical protein